MSLAAANLASHIQQNGPIRVHLGEVAGSLLIFAGFSQEDDAVHDPDYIPPDDDEYDPYEYDSDHESIDLPLHEEQTDLDSDSHAQDHEDQWYQDWLSTFVSQEDLPGEPIRVSDGSPEQDVFIPVHDNVPGMYTPEDLLHVPGPTCGKANTYSGHGITLEEMRGCRTAQCLIHNTIRENWERDGLEQDWELSGEYFLSGLSDGMPSRDEDPRRVFPVRGGVARPESENILFDSQSHFGHVNTTGLMNWRKAECTFEDFHGFPRDAAVIAGQEQFWLHEPGQEYLVANPLYVPNLVPLLLAAIKEDGNFNLSYGAFDIDQEREHHEDRSLEHPNDPLFSLSHDLRLLLLEYLGSHDIANLRLASRAFHQLPISLWHRLIREEMPWVWEAWDENENNHSLSLWTSITANEMQMLCKLRKHYFSVLGDGSQDAILDGKIIDEMLSWPPAIPSQIKLPRAKTNWYEVYSGITRNWDQLKGLQNRKRIWKDVDGIIRRIQTHEQ
ncbi:hypothetical protein N7510_010609 [Penicillium lagena]|uniref:uncharacterized protein n=1 Tax=Penicillium lagena TaxID=94218 RepID=UPI00254103EF|nr:uncharacterized protein N7510_010609 [Penicillium lagena]KAJ5601075.1 hypothetical protein N7510_010609 [Penicillium lagena]